ncbi:MAG: GNVR domain-containing protein [bacterium]|nr:GNVR domain-containing protein [bacterium]
MPPEESTNELQRVFEIAWRRKWIILVPFVSIFLLVTLWALYQPNLYRSSSSMFVEAQEVPADYVRSTITDDIQTRMRSINQRLTSRTKLLTVIKKLDLYPELVEKGAPSEVLVAAMQKDLEVEIPTNRRDANFFVVHFVHRDATKAMLAVSNLVSLFVEESLQVRELQAEGTTKFIEDELEKLKTILEEQEQAVQSYKARYMGELPDQLDANLRMLDNLQLQLTSNQESQRELDGRLMMLEQEISRLEGEMDAANSISTGEGEAPVTSTTLNQLVARRDALRQRIANMESMYTDQHPDLLAARRELSRVENSLKSAREELAMVQPSSRAPVIVAPGPGYSMELNNLRRQLTEIRPRLASLQQEETALHGRITQYQRRVEAAPRREQQLTQLTRDYENTKTSYEDLLNKRMEAQMSENLEKRQKGEKFQILDAANFPEKPYLPNRPKIMAMGFAGGMGAGMGLALLLEALFPAFYSLKQVQLQVSDMPIAFAIPHISSQAERTRSRRRAAVGLLFFVGVSGLSIYLLNRYVVDLGEFMNVVKTNVKGML